MKEKKKRKKRSTVKPKTIAPISADPEKVTGRYFFGVKTRKELETILAKLKAAWLSGCNSVEACAFAGINRRALYRYMEKHPELIEERDNAQLNPKIVAKMALLTQMQSGDGNLSLQYLERVSKEEFSKTINFSSIKDDKLTDGYKGKVIEAMEAIGEEIDDDVIDLIDSGERENKTNRELLNNQDEFDKEIGEINKE